MQFATLQTRYTEFQNQMITDLLMEQPEAIPASGREWENCFEVVGDSVFLAYNVLSSDTTDYYKRDGRELIDA